MRTQPRLGTIGSMDATDDNEGRAMTIAVPHDVERTQVSAEREKVYFVSGDTQCAALHYPGTNGACVIMAGGFAVTMEPGTERFAERFNAAGFTVLAFDYRHLGDSRGQPRQIVRIREQLWQQEVAARSPLRVAFYLPGRYASRVRCPLLVLVCDQDQSALAEPAVRAAKRAPRGNSSGCPAGTMSPS
jgi:fermentation-respiration switch protein FrsA (DUF1100 family)